ncbi:MAG: hypothetical protein ACRCTP_04435 [Aeromonas popoffii]|uniref:hypothetical protein n=1 Tax=Aeromonas popoffii TaxID=70856 RepID=UPI003F368E87
MSNDLQFKSAPAVIIAPDINQVVCRAIRELKLHGVDRPSRNGPTRSISRAELILTNPRSRYLNLPGRESNIFQMIAETFWVMAGEDRIAPFLEFFLPRAANYSDDGLTWRGAYGPRMYELNQLEGVVKAFVEDGLDTRRAVLAIFNPNRDSPDALEQVYGLEKTKDLPCNNFINFWIDADKFFHMDIIQRSGDIIWGTGSINLYEFSFLQECVFNLVRNATGDQTIKLGSYCQRVTNLHYYPEVVGAQVANIYDSNPLFCHSPIYGPQSGAIDLGGMNDAESMRAFFSELYDLFTALISGGELTGSEILGVFDKYGVEAAPANTLWVTANVVYAHIVNKFDETIKLSECLFKHHPALLGAIQASKFNRTNIETAE